VFWDVAPVRASQEGEPEEPLAQPVTLPVKQGTAASFAAATSRIEQVAFAEQYYKEENYSDALRCYESGLNLVCARPIFYHHAAVAAFRLGDYRRALEILKEAESLFSASEIPAAMIFNMGCCAARLGWIARAMHYLKRAVEAGYADPERYRSDPDLQLLRWRPEFEYLVKTMKERVSP
jgi:tetratricopeptide (TPR) repeat protein